ncbi:hypothetical protein M413DRAFT_265391 [Hebeloma cylindrosporum]|uniref:Uncharacterized protein n=1 Tax=Hebeloma cylindrosporum TaxID=76867 RepID=A0A0C3CSL9_HEBCY|nr:hypothetical protein M413DRAFT_265391 [Hebeloma cylindrosporum h7]
MIRTPHPFPPPRPTSLTLATSSCRLLPLAILCPSLLHVCPRCLSDIAAQPMYLVYPALGHPLANPCLETASPQVGVHTVHGPRRWRSCLQGSHVCPSCSSDIPAQMSRNLSLRIWSILLLAILSRIPYRSSASGLIPVGTNAMDE